MNETLKKLAIGGLVIMLIGSILFFEQLHPVVTNIRFSNDAYAAGNYFIKALGESGTENFTYSRGMDVTSDGGMIVTAQTSSFGAPSGSMMVSKVSSEGTVEWTKTVSDIAGDSVTQTTDGGYVIVGATNDYGLSDTGWGVVKLNSSGVEQWTITLDTTGNQNPNSVEATSDGGVIIGGRAPTFGFDPIAVKLDSSGNIEWQNRFGTTSYDDSLNIIPVSDGGYLSVGGTLGFSVSTSAWLIQKFNSSGVEQWTKTIDGSGAEGAISAVETSDGGFAVVGYTASWGEGGNDIMVSKLNSSGVEQWTRTIGGSGAEQGFGIDEASDGDLLVAAFTASIGTGPTSGVIIRMTSTGTEEWTRTISGSGNESFRSIEENSDGSISALGLTTTYGAGLTDLWVARLDSNGEVGTCSSIVDETASLTFSSQTVSEVNRTQTEVAISLTRATETVTETDQTAASSNQCYALGPVDGSTTISATVDPTLSFVLRDSTDTGDSNVCNLGSMGPGSVASCSYRLGAETNASSGYTVRLVADGPLTSGSDTIANIASQGTVSSGTEGYGVAVTGASAGGESGGVTVDSSFDTNDNPVPTSNSALLSINEPFDYQAGTTTTSSLITHKVGVTSVTPAGTYTQTLTYTVTGNF